MGCYVAGALVVPAALVLTFAFCVPHGQGS